MWQELREELHPQGLEIVTVGLDAAGAEPCRPFIEAAQPSHPSLIDRYHAVAEIFGIFNIPTAVWINEEGVIVRPAEQAQPRESTPEVRFQRIDGMPDHMNDILDEASRIQVDTRYVSMVREWVANGAASPFVLSPDEVVARSAPRDASVAEGQAHFALGSYLFQQGDRDGARRHWREAHRLVPGNFSYKRQAWSLEAEDMGPLARFWQGPVPGKERDWPYETDWLTEVRAMGAENYYPPVNP